MKSKILKFYICLAIFLLIVPSAFAAVYTEPFEKGKENTVYVAGRSDFYPFEYYNEKTKQYEGIFPEILEQISSDTGIDFTYIKASVSQRSLASNLQAEVVSAYDFEKNQAYAAHTVPIMQYMLDGKNVTLGFAFTKIASPTLIKSVERSASRVDNANINGYFVSLKPAPKNNIALYVFGAVFAVVSAFCIVLIVKLKKKTKRDVDIAKTTDSETGMGNFAHFEYSFNNIISDFSRSLYYVVCILADSEYIRSYHGEGVFSDTIKYSAEIISSHMTDNSFAARIGENAFLAAIQASDDETVKKTVKEILKQLDEYVDDSESRANKLFVASIYKLKKSDRDLENVVFNVRKSAVSLIGGDTDLTEFKISGKASKEKNSVERFKEAFKLHEFKLYTQFIADSKTKKLVSAECLSRWESSEVGLIFPKDYISLMEKTGFIVQHDFYMFEEACKCLHKWQNTELEYLSLSCNFTRITLSEEDFIKKLENIEKSFTFDRKRLILEITEDTLERNRDIVLENIRRCKEMGYKIALDDMGSGYTSLINLCEYPIDILKIDRDILLKTDSERGKNLFIGIVSLAHSLGLKVVCEGIETKEQSDWVCETSCDMLQGWYYSRAFPVSEGESFLKNYSLKLENNA